MRTQSKVLLLAALVMLLSACDIGGTRPTTQLTSAGGAGSGYSLNTVASIAPGFLRSFNVTGADTRGDSLSGTWSIQNLATTTFNGQSAVPRTQTLGLTNQATNGFTTIQETLFLGTGFQILGWSDNLSNVRCTPLAAFATPPAVVLIGDTGQLGTLGCSDGSRRQFAWRVDATTGGDAILVLQMISLDATGAPTATEEDGFVLDPTGGIHGVTFLNRDIATGVTVTLQSPVI